jgi:hypothetical protein
MNQPALPNAWLFCALKASSWAAGAAPASTVESVRRIFNLLDVAKEIFNAHLIDSQEMLSQLAEEEAAESGERVAGSVGKEHSIREPPAMKAYAQTSHLSIKACSPFGPVECR